ncbi:LOW QUALITY PROTEIN: hypothetical protein BDA96_08G155800 [Sorghum bicolor]|uniref:Uncharacterized protein n=1 Tax=Sorghum bicolor TaxID=4558 RepID=A0A921QFV6_SORBI|nr:LOW QUALITY PROTEIN: hypothetical protein BDA96_08G155800 [Sorghum bicolor]
MSFPGALLELIAEARLNPSRLPVALITFGVVLSAAALALIVFKTPGGIFLRLHGSTPTYLYYGILTVVLIFGLAEASLGFWVVVPHDDDDDDDVDGDGGWRNAAGKTVLWVSLLPLVLVFALGGLAFLK